MVLDPLIHSCFWDGKIRILCKFKLSPCNDFWNVGSIPASGHEDLVTWVGFSAKKSFCGFWRGPLRKAHFSGRSFMLTF